MDIEQVKQNIWTAIKDYGRHTDMTSVLDDVSDSFVDQLARDSIEAKSELRALFSQSPVYDAALDALVINGTRTHDPDISFIRQTGEQILRPAYYDGKLTMTQRDGILNFFTTLDEDVPGYIAQINEVAPKAYAKGKKRSRVFKAVCTALGIADETAGSEFQRLYAMFADELSTRRIGFKLYVSLNPAHFITMSNPKGDARGDTMTSCHSFNNTEYQYNNGCSGYARDSVTFIAFTVSDPKDPETLNNRKTTRQIYAYEPGNGVLLQSRLYNTSGGTRGAQEESKLYRDLIQREISMLEGQPNLWKTYDSAGSEYSYLIQQGEGFGGYADWTFTEFAGKISIRNDHLEDRHPITVGTWGLCICCGDETSEWLYCDRCRDGDDDDRVECDECGCYVDSDGVTYVRNSRGYQVAVCQSCLERYYSYCDHCEEYYPNDDVTRLHNGRYFCEDCLNEYATQCDECGEWFEDEDKETEEVHDDEDSTRCLCEDCRRDDYEECDRCYGIWHVDFMFDGDGERVCTCCHDRFYPEREEDEAV